MSNIVFIGGIHGAGKGSICREICKQTNLVHLTASNILKWNEISKVDNKKVKDIQRTQNRLIEGLRQTKNDKDNYLLDGHFCLLNSDGHVETIPVETFEEISPQIIAIVITEIKTIQERLRRRDEKVYDYKTLDYMQLTEVTQATKVASILKVPFIKITDCDTRELIKLFSLLPTKHPNG